MQSVAYKWRVLVAVVIGIFMVVMDTAMVNVALPAIMSAFNASLDRAQLVISMYLLALALVIPTTGYIADRLGTKRAYTLSIAGFTGIPIVWTGLGHQLTDLLPSRLGSRRWYHHAFGDGPHFPHRVP